MLLVHVWDVQHGSAAFVRFPDGRFMVHDLGAGFRLHRGIAFSPLQKLRADGVTELDTLVVTHPHRDHIDDILSLDAVGFRPRAFSRPRGVDVAPLLAEAAGRPADLAKYRAYQALDSTYTEPIDAATDLCRPEGNGGVTVSHFWARKVSRDNLNNVSLVTVLAYDSFRVLLTGDNEAPSWSELLADRQFVEAIRGHGILLAPHHGRDAGWDSRLFDVFTPLISIVSDDENPDTSAASRYSAVSTGALVLLPGRRLEQRKCLTTRADGDIRFEVEVGQSGPLLHVRTFGTLGEGYRA